eukprot:CAMPEP_0175055470 /NCGR_PEP_ID=MMETSP0052_2-20121109/10097_1 /TAXON_ID=51329 ORGANISM="Polytomella parva, Strain SAG 63-3" /NCGR_SAMPLE_ID=MMETSP0052_2 /ASSEMBLY_ACC=CAM_ASM_000194 /LENGTH=151 /DNA_ID=CAMNT_0016320317 /DNA_START=236 /DNA_END=688 /DNA_ORIENTATION=-
MTNSMANTMNAALTSSSLMPNAVPKGLEYGAGGVGMGLGEVGGGGGGGNGDGGNGGTRGNVDEVRMGRGRGESNGNEREAAVNRVQGSPLITTDQASSVSLLFPSDPHKVMPSLPLPSANPFQLPSFLVHPSLPPPPTSSSFSNPLTSAFH